MFGEDEQKETLIDDYIFGVEDNDDKSDSFKPEMRKSEGYKHRSKLEIYE